MHGNGTSHADSTTTTVFLGDDNSVKLGDFGLSKILQSHDFASTYVGTPFYMSPEICKAEQYGPHSDIWALGCIIYEMCAKQPPFNAKTHFDLIQKIKSGRYPDIPACYSAELRKVIWPGRRELITYTTVVIVFVAFMVALVAGMDLLFSRGVIAVFG